MFLFSLHDMFLPFHSCLQYIVQRFVKLARSMANFFRFADFLLSPRAWVFPKSLLIALWNITFTLLALVLCFISCWKNILFNLLSRLFVAKNYFYNHINFYVEVTNALKVVYREVLRHRPYNKKTTEKWNLKHSPTNEPSLSQVTFNCFIHCTYCGLTSEQHPRDSFYVSFHYLSRLIQV